MCVYASMHLHVYKHVNQHNKGRNEDTILTAEKLLLLLLVKADPHEPSRVMCSELHLYLKVQDAPLTLEKLGRITLCNPSQPGSAMGFSGRGVSRANTY